MYSKAQIYNLALGALLLSRQIINTDTDPSNEAKMLNLHWDIALNSSLQDMDLDSTSTRATLQLIAQDPIPGWHYSYLYPANCSFFRRIPGHHVHGQPDCRYTAERKHITIINSQKVILTNKREAIAEYIPSDFPISTLIAPAVMTIAYKLAWLASPLVTGKGALQLKKELEQKYMAFKAEAQQQDSRENFNFVDPAIESEFVAERTS